MKTINFNNVQIENIDGTITSVNLKKDFANSLYLQGNSLLVVELARKIWHSVDAIQIDEDEANIIKQYIEKFYESYIIRDAILKQIQ